MKNFAKKLESYDLMALQSEKKDWPELSLLEKYWKINATILVNDLNVAKKIISLHEKDLSETGMYNYFNLLIKYECQSDYSKELFSNLKRPAFIDMDPILYADYHFSLGLIFLREKNGRLAEQFYMESLKTYELIGLGTLAWRSKFNLLLSRAIVKKFSGFDVQLEDLILLMDELPSKAIKTFGRFLIWTLLYRGRNRQAIRLCSRLYKMGKIVKDSTFLEKERTIVKYQIYLNIVFQNIEPQECLIKAAGSFGEEISVLKGYSKFILSDFISKINIWSLNFNIVDRFMLSECLLVILNKDRRHYEVIRLFKTIEERKIPTEGLIIPPSTLYQYPLFASEALKKVKAEKYYLNQVRLTAPSWRVREVEIELEKRKASSKKKQLEINNLKKTTLFEGTEVFFARKPKLFRAIVELSQLSGKTKLNIVYNTIYGDKCNFDKLSKLKNLLRRVKVTLKIQDLYYMDSKYIHISSDYKWVLRGVEKKRAQVKVHGIIELLKLHPEGTGSLLISQKLDIPKRTINMHLKVLIESEIVLKEGIGRSTRYFLNK